MGLLQAFAGLMGLAPGSSATPLAEMERLVFEVCPRIFVGSLNFSDERAWPEIGLTLGAADENDQRTVLRGSNYSIRIGANDTNQVCHVTYVGPNAADLYEQALERVRSRGFAFVHGERAAPEAEFILDTLASEAGPVGVISMFRVHVVPPTQFRMTAMAPISENSTATEQRN